MRIAQTQLRKSEAQALLMMIGVDIAFLVLSFIHSYTAYLPSASYAVTQHQSYAELFQYAKIVCCILLLARTFYRGRESLLFSWMLVFTYLLLVEAFNLHQILARFTLEILAVDPARAVSLMRSVELIWAGCIVILFIVLMMLQFSHSHEEVKKDSQVLACMVTILFLFTFVLDHVQVAIQTVDTQLFHLAAMIEDFGGMLCMSLAVIGVHLVYVRTLRSKRHPGEASPSRSRRRQAA